MKKYEITIITSDLPAAEQAQQVVQKMDMYCRVVNVRLDDLANTAQDLVAQGTKVLIAFGLFAKIVRQSVSVPVIMVDLNPDDVLDSLLRAAKIGKRIAIFGFRKVLKDVMRIRDLLAIDLVAVPTVMPGQMPETIAGLKEIDVLVGGYYQVSLAKKLGIPTVLITPRDQEIEKAIYLAVAYLDKDEEIESRKELTLPESSVYASITVDPDGNIILMNRLASEYLGVSRLDAVSFTMDEICPQFTRVTDAISKRHAYINQIAKIGEKTFLYHTEPMLLGDQVQGVTITFQDANTVLGAGASIRRTLVTRTNQAEYTLDQIVGQSVCMERTLRLALKYSHVDETVLILGETGVGKELFAQGIHRASGRKDGPFVAINCASLPESILESELFGYVKGAFTGADRNGKRGLFELAHKGTIFLDEIGEISGTMQGKLLRVLQEHCIRRIGDEKPIPVDIRVIAATNRDLIRMVREEKFRSDLYFRINVLVLQIPPLRDRGEDMVLLANQFLMEASVRNNRQYTLSEAARKAIKNYSWPGNIRELQNMIRRVTVISDSADIGEELVLEYICENRSLSPENTETKGSEKIISLEEALRQTGYNKKKTAELLGVSRSTLYRMLSQKEKEMT